MGIFKKLVKKKYYKFFKHINEGTIHLKETTGSCGILSQESLCGIAGNELTDLHQKCEDENTIRIKAAERHNEHGDVCGNCMKVLYKN